MRINKGKYSLDDHFKWINAQFSNKLIKCYYQIQCLIFGHIIDVQYKNFDYCSRCGVKMDNIQVSILGKYVMEDRINVLYRAFEVLRKQCLERNIDLYRQRVVLSLEEDTEFIQKEDNQRLEELKEKKGKICPYNTNY